ncbi:MAG: hypothetical protein RIQ43_1648 [Pseudomonadota bacterium]
MPTEHERIERVLDGALPPESLAPQRLHRAMRHATLDGGKRLRARLVYATGRLFGLSMTQLDSAAAAVEMIHAYSLIHDDLPAMDDDALRRGKLAYETLARAEWPDAAKLAALQELISASGSRGMCGGQQLDMEAGGKTPSLTDLQNVHALKTGALIKAAIRLPAIVADADRQARAALDAFADDLGLAFQIQDDILDVEASTAQLGKSAGKDAEQAKATYPALLGLDGAKALLAGLAERMPGHLSGFGERAEALSELAAFAVARRN